MDFLELTLVYFIAFIIILLASYIPAKKAAKLDVTEAIKFNL